MREPRAWWLLLIAICAGYAVFASLVSVSYTAVYGLSRWTLKPDTTAIFPYLVMINLFLWVGFALAMPAIFWLGRRFRFDREGWRRALLVHVPASLLFTTLHLVLVGTFRYYLQGLRGGNPDWEYTVWEAVFRTIDLELPIYWAIVGLQHAADNYRQARARELRAARLEMRLVEAQLQTLQQQLHPHFLFNTLHAISTLVHRDPDKADSMIERLSDLLRMTLNKVGVQEVELAEELAYVRSYLDIEQIHFGPRLRVDYRVDAAALDAMVPTLILQPLVENAIRHGLEPQVGGGCLTIEAQTGVPTTRTLRRGVEAEGDTLWLRVRDTGTGLAKHQPRLDSGSTTRVTPRGGAGDGVGLANTRSRLDRLYGEQAALTIRENPGGGTLVDLYLPLRRSAKTTESAAAPLVYPPASPKPATKAGAA